MSALLENLNKAQKQAVTHEGGPLLIVAGAGTGKTTVLINRLAYLITEKKVPSESLLLLTFTEKAAQEMEERADRVLPYGYVDLWINTFHSFGERLLRDHALDIGLDAGFKLLTETEQWLLIRQNLEAFDLDYYRPLGNPTKFISELIRHFSRLKDENVSPKEYLEYAEGLVADEDHALSGEDDAPTEAARIKELANAYHVYNRLLLDKGYLDFGDLIIYTIKLLSTRPAILEQYRRQFRYIMVDEFQDTNWAQYELVKLLAAPDNNLVVVGDDDQAIYKFRGASLSNIMQFKDDFPQAEEIVLTENYRSRQAILDAAYHFIQNNNPDRLEEKLKIDKRLFAKKPFALAGEKEALIAQSFPTAADELSFVAAEIRRLYEEAAAAGEDPSWSDFAILVRANDTADAYVKELGRQGIPNQFMSWRGLYYKPLILDILAYLRLLDNYHESSALFRVLSMEAFKVSHLDLVAINKMAARKVWSLFEALKNIRAIPGVSPEAEQNVTRLLALIEKHSSLADKEKPTKIFLHFAYDSGLLNSLDQDRDLESFSYLDQFYQKIKRLEENNPDLRLSDFLEIMNMELEAGETGALKLDFADAESVKIMTVHGAKGLEFPYVFLVNLVDKKFPTISRSEKIGLPDALVREQAVADKDAHLAEERRLFYVAATRAKERLYLSGAKDYGGVREKKPSRFLEEMGVSPVDVSSSLASYSWLRDSEKLQAGETEVPTEPEYPLPDKFSFSQLAAFSTCPRQYKYAFVLKIPASSDKASLIFGRVLHNTLYAFLLPTLSGQQSFQKGLFDDQEAASKKPRVVLTEKKLLEIYEDNWQADGYKDKKERDDYKKKGREALKLFWKEYSSTPPLETVFLEKKFSFKIAGDIIKGAIDRIDRLEDGTLEIIDYKTGKTKTKLDFSEKRQLILYQLFAEEAFGIKVGRLSYYYLESGEKFSFTATEKDISRLRLEVAEEIAAIKRRNFSATPSPMCAFCDFNTICEFRQR
jgi:DNA helicase-2/ATP-dependent DNA helicase PcrA